MTASKHSSILNDVDHNFRQCWEILCELKTKPTPKLRLFQPLLCDAMLKLSAEFRRLNRERSDLAARSAQLNSRWLTRRQAALAEAKQALRRAKGIGQSLGNAFAWFFYQHEPRLLELHAKHPYTDSLHADIGGAGEHAFISEVPMCDGAIVLHHGITSILRIGDISLFDLKAFRVKGLGEIKTSQVSKNELRLTVSYFADTQFTSANLSEGPQRRLRAIVSRSQRKKLKKQVEEMISTLKARKEKQPSTGATLHEDRRLANFSSALKAARVGKFSSASITDGLVALVYRQRKCPLAAALRRKTPIDFNVRLGSPPELEQIGLAGSPNNAIHLESFFYTEKGDPIHAPGTMPLLWWNVDLELVRRVMFQELVVLTIFNPAHLIAKLENKGFTVAMSAEDGKLHVSRRAGNQEASIQGMEYFTRLITQGLYSEEMVVEIVERTATAAFQRGEETRQPGRLEVVFNHSLWAPRTAEA